MPSEEPAEKAFYALSPENRKQIAMELLRTLEAERHQLVLMLAGYTAVLEAAQKRMKRGETADLAGILRTIEGHRRAIEEYGLRIDVVLPELQIVAPTLTDA